MCAVRDSFPDRIRATDSLRPPALNRMRPLPSPRIVPTRRSRPSRVLLNPEPTLSPSVATPRPWSDRLAGSHSWGTKPKQSTHRYPDRA